MRKKTVLILVFLFFSLYSSFFAKEIKVTLPFLMDKAALMYPELKKKYHELIYAHLRENEVYYKKFPKISFNAYFNYVPLLYKQDGALKLDFKDWSPFAAPQLSLSVPVYTFGKISNASKAAKYNVEVKKAEIEETTAFVSYQVKKIYWGYLLLKSLNEFILKDTIKKYEKILSDKEKAFGEGKASRADLESTRISYYGLKKNQAEAIKRYKESLSWLKMICSAKEKDKIKIESARLVPVNFSPKPIYVYLDLAKKYNPGFKKVHYGYLAKKFWYKYKQASLMPDIFFFLNATYIYHTFDQSKFDIIIPDREWNFYFGFGIRFDLTIWNTINEHKKNKIEYLKDLETIKVGSRFLEIKLKQAYENMIEKKKRLEYSKAQFKAAKRWVILSINAYEAGTGNSSDAQNGIATLFQRKKDYYTSIYDYNVAIAEFEKLLGMDIVNYNKIVSSKGEEEE